MTPFRDSLRSLQGGTLSYFDIVGEEPILPPPKMSAQILPTEPVVQGAPLPGNAPKAPVNDIVKKEDDVVMETAPVTLPATIVSEKMDIAPPSPTQPPPPPPPIANT